MKTSTLLLLAVGGFVLYYFYSKSSTTTATVPTTTTAPASGTTSLESQLLALGGSTGVLTGLGTDITDLFGSSSDTTGS